MRHSWGFGHNIMIYTLQHIQAVQADMQSLADVCPPWFVVCRARFWVDLAAWFPFDWIVLWCFDAAKSDNFHRWLGVLTMLRMVIHLIAAQYLGWRSGCAWCQTPFPTKQIPASATLLFLVGAGINRSPVTPQRFCFQFV